MKQFTLFFLLLFSCYGNSQEINSNNYKTPNGLLDRIFDNYGTALQLHDIEVSPKTKADGTIITSELLYTAGIFEVYYEQGSGMELLNDANHIARRNVINKVFTDLSNFLITPLKNSGNTQKVKIWIRDYEQIQNLTNAQVSYGSSYYNVATDVANNASIADNQLWKTINSGKEAYTNVSNTYKDGQNLIQFYHATLAFNFGNNNEWNTKLDNVATSSEYDLYTYTLRETVHALGFISLIDHKGNSKFGGENKFYSRFDTFLRNQQGQNLITTAGSCSPIHDIEFTGTLSDLSLNCLSSLPDYQTDCNNSIHFVGSNSTNIYTPNCYNNTTSLNFISEMCYEQNSFLMGASVNQGSTIRKMTDEERIILSDIGYSFNATYGNTEDLSYNDYNSQLLTESVVGINDGFEKFSYVYAGDTSTPTIISGFLSNDIPNSNIKFECLKDVTDNYSTFSTNSGDSSTFIELSSTVSGLHLLSYIPYDENTGKRGNITYVYVYLRLFCNTLDPTPCNYITNGNFETNVGFPSQFGQMEELVCNWYEGVENPDYLHRFSTSSQWGIPNNIQSNTQNEINIIAPGSEDAYSGIVIDRSLFPGDTFPGESEIILSNLNTPLLPNTSYHLSFHVLKSSLYTANAEIQACFVNQEVGFPFTQTNAGNFIPPVGSILLDNDKMITNSTAWEQINFDFTTDNIAGHNFFIH